MSYIYYSDENKFKILRFQNTFTHLLNQNFHKCVISQRNIVHEIIQGPKNIEMISLCKYEPTIQETRRIEFVKNDLHSITLKPCNVKRLSIDDVVDRVSNQNLNYFKESYDSDIGNEILKLQLRIDINSINTLTMTRSKKFDFIYHKGMQKYIHELVVPFLNIREFIQTHPNQIFEYFKLKDLLPKFKTLNVLTYSHFNKFITFVKNFDLEYVLDFIDNNKIDDYERQRTNISHLLLNLKGQQINILLDGVRFTNYGITFGHFQTHSTHPMNNEYFISHLAKHNLFDKLTFQLNKIKLLSL